MPGNENMKNGCRPKTNLFELGLINNQINQLYNIREGLKKKCVKFRGCQFVSFMQITTFSTCKHKPNLQVKAKKTVCITQKSLLFSIFFFGKITHLVGWVGQEWDKLHRKNQKKHAFKIHFRPF